MRNNDLNVQVFQNRNPRYSLKSVRQFFFLALTVRKKGKKIWGYGPFSEKKEAMDAELNERVETATSSYSAAVDFLILYLFGACD